MSSTPPILAVCPALAPTGATGVRIAAPGGDFARLLADSAQATVGVAASSTAAVAPVAVATAPAASFAPENGATAIAAGADDETLAPLTRVASADPAAAAGAGAGGDDRPAPVPAATGRQPCAGRGKPSPPERQPAAPSTRQRPDDRPAATPADTASNGTVSKTSEPTDDLQASPMDQGPGMTADLAAAPSPLLVDRRTPVSFTSSTEGKPSARRAQLLASAPVGIGIAPPSDPAVISEDSAPTPARSDTARQSSIESDTTTDRASSLVASPIPVAVTTALGAETLSVAPAPFRKETLPIPADREPDAAPTLVPTVAAPSRPAIDANQTSATAGAPSAAPPPAGGNIAQATAQPVQATGSASLWSPATAPVRLVGGAALQALGAAATVPSPLAVTASAATPAIVAAAAPVPVATPPTPIVRAVETPAVSAARQAGTVASPSSALRPAPEPPATMPPGAGAPARAAIGTTAPAGQAFAAAIEAADRQDRLAANRGLTESAVAAGAVASPTVVAASAGAGADQPGLDMRQQGWPAAMVDHIERLRDAADATSTRIRVVPDALGSIDVAVRRHVDGAVQVSLAADRPATQALIAEAQPELARLAGERGTRLEIGLANGGAGGGDTASFGAGTDGRHTPAQPQPARRPASAPGFLSDDPIDPADGRVA